MQLKFPVKIHHFLGVLDISNTVFVGPLDGSIFESMQKLIYLRLNNNEFNSTMPLEIAHLPELKALYANKAGIQDNLDWLPYMPNIFEVWLDENPQLKGTIPIQISAMTNLASLSISNCNIEGSIPSELASLPRLTQVWLFGNSLTGKIPRDIGNMDSLRVFSIEDNDIVDTMPPEICSLRLDNGLVTLTADCGGDDAEVSCETGCCTCCISPCFEAH